MASETERLRARLEAAGWSVTHLRDGALVVRDVVKDVTRGSATKGHLIGRFTRIGDCVDGDFEELSERRMAGPLLAMERIGATKLFVEVRDVQRAREEVLALAAIRDATSFDAAMALVEARGFTLDRSRCMEDTYDTHVWEIRARRAGEHIDVGARLVPHGLSLREGAFVNDFGDAELRDRPNALLMVAVRSLAAAEELLGVLVAASQG